MSPRALLRVTAVLTCTLGVAWLAAPEHLLSEWRLDPSVSAVYVARRYAVLFFGFALLTWRGAGREHAASWPLLLDAGLTVSASIGALTLWGLLSGTVGPVGWVAFGIEAAMTVAFVFTRWTRTAQAQAVAD